MVVKTITVTASAYGALKSLKLPRESFSDAIIRIAKRKPLSEFFGVLGRSTGERMEKAIADARKKRNKAHRARVDYIVKSFSER
ncbi:antitoxin VapB family protein [Candidatus Woesearchaeota archaeon]|nr:antitoxin VapB family protein [Candidatus Woesearchaeota archaeon]